MLARAQMTIRDEADVVIRSTAPASPVTDMLWLDTSSTPHQLKRWNGSAWVECGANVDLSAYYTKTEMDTKIAQTNSAIALKADSSTVSSLGDRLAQAEQKITPEGIAASVTSAAYYAYEKYAGRNYCLNSGNVHTFVDNKYRYANGTEATGMMTEIQTQYLLTCSILRQMRNAGLITAKEYADLDTRLLQKYGLSLCSILSDTRLITSPVQR